MAKMKPIYLRYLLIFALILAVALILMFNTSKLPSINEKKQKETMQNIKLPTNFGIKVFASGLGKSFSLPGPNSGPRFMGFYKDTLFVSIP
ncbi:MAG TPA: hypothetical protein VI564_02625, partial [Candidatus Nanoarchaeia archaeon]|nr:hypothetical protein [Candidatus Nanoarchaeia archaeon]